MQTAIDKDESKTIEIKEESPILKEESFYCEKDQSNVSEQATECKDLTFKSFSGSARQKRKSIWEDEEPSTSSDNAAESEKLKLRRMSAEILSTYTLFSQGQTRSATEESSASVPKYDEDFATATQTTTKFSESTAEVPANSTWVYRHKSVFDFAKAGNKPPDQLPLTYFSSGTKSPSLFSNSLLNSPWGKKSEATSTDLLKYNLFSRSNSDDSSMISYNTSEQGSTSTTYNNTTKPSFHFTQIPSIKEKSMDIYECGADSQNTSGNTEDKKEKSLCVPQALPAIDTGARKGPVSNTIIHTPETTFHPDDKDSLPQSDIEVKKEEAENSVNSTDADISPAEHYNVHIKAAQFPGGKTNRNECPSVKIEPADYQAQDQNSASTSTSNIWATKEVSPELHNLFKGKDVNTSLLS